MKLFMSWRSDQFVPSASIIDAVIDTGIQPMIARVISDVGISNISAAVSVWQYDDRVMQRGITRCGPNQEHTNAELRVRFRETIKPERLLFFAQLLMHEPKGSARFVGMIIRGDVKTSASGNIVSVSSGTSLFNHMDWVDPAEL